MLISTGITIVDFSDEGSMRNWRVTNDTVMGGQSSASFKGNENGIAVFSGSVSTANNGGFSMVRLAVKVPLNNEVETLKLKLKGDGKKYQFRLKSSNSQPFWYVQSFQTSDEWEEITLKLKDFYPSYRGYRLNNGNFSSSAIREIAILIGNKKNEDFKLMIESIGLE